ncbi:Short-chain dehydrogenase [Micromonospora nigra]|uniref:Short-chain dehydrogenase n=1 Tax=Micromonospora nigra TaxID=145857 RepID=A0A1C6RDJ8_9ACTN|nr:SDR family oxidoreductase [Micromonospora nigra]SCL15034.1 Short-chain dehydrogenase [Micromonospora nigra]
MTQSWRKTVLVTGANQGIGRVTAFELARAGFSVFATTRSEEKAEALRDEAARVGLTLRTVVVELTDVDATAEAFAEVAAATDGGPWAVVNNAGYAQAGAVEDVDDARVRNQLEVNVLAPVRLARLALPSMRARGTGRIVNMSSFGGLIVEPFLGWYMASKFALEAISDALRMEVAQFGVQVVLIEPGGFSSGIWQRGVDGAPPRENSAYAGFYNLADAMLEHAAALPQPDPVARAVRHALTVDRPRARYPVGTDVKVGSVLETVLPTPALDWVKGLRSGLHKPQSVPGRVTANLLSRFF